MTQSTRPSPAGARAPAPAGHGPHSFDTPEPVSLSVDLIVGAVHVTATDHRETVVEVLPSHPGQQSDLSAAEQTVVERIGNLVAVRTPRRWTRYIHWGDNPSVDVEIALPAGSEVRVDASMATVLCSGRIGESEISTGFGEVRIDEAGPLRVHTGFGDISVERAVGRVEAKTGSGAVRLGAIDGPAVVRNSNGDTWIGEVSGDVEVRSANGRIVVDRAEAAVTARTANGDVLLGEVARGAVLAHTAAGRIEVGVRAGVAAWLELHTHYGNVHNDLEDGAPPGPGEDTVEIRATTSYGDITLRRM
jgi:hypothetical protein